MKYTDQIFNHPDHNFPEKKWQLVRVSFLLTLKKQNTPNTLNFQLKPSVTDELPITMKHPDTKVQDPLMKQTTTKGHSVTSFLLKMEKAHFSCRESATLIQST